MNRSMRFVAFGLAALLFSPPADACAPPHFIDVAPDAPVSELEFGA